MYSYTYPYALWIIFQGKFCFGQFYKKLGLGQPPPPRGPKCLFFVTEHLLYWSILHSLVTYNSIILEQNVDEYWSICYFNQPPKTLPEAQRTQDIRLQRWYITIPSSDQWCTTIENHRYQWLSYPKTIGKPLIPMVALNHSIQWWW